PVMVDPLQCELAVLNMAINARDAIPQGGSLSIRLSQLEPGARDVAASRLRLEVTDSGCGMSEEVLVRAFEPFFTTKAVGEATGLCLAQEYGFALQSRVEVPIDSEIIMVTRLRLLLPFANQTAQITVVEHRIST